MAELVDGGGLDLEPLELAGSRLLLLVILPDG
jgi:hypothetical protein